MGDNRDIVKALHHINLNLERLNKTNERTYDLWSKYIWDNVITNKPDFDPVWPMDETKDDD